jgi:hypothetical protein
MVLDAAPVPGLIELEPVATGAALPEPAETPALPVAYCADHEGQEDTSALPEFPTKKAAFLSLYRGHPAYGVREQASPLAAELAPKAGLQPGTGRTYILEELRRLDHLAEVTSGNGE